MTWQRQGSTFEILSAAYCTLTQKSHQTSSEKQQVEYFKSREVTDNCLTMKRLKEILRTGSADKTTSL